MRIRKPRTERPMHTKIIRIEVSIPDGSKGWTDEEAKEIAQAVRSSVENLALDILARRGIYGAKAGAIVAKGGQVDKSPIELHGWQ